MLQRRKTKAAARASTRLSEQSRVNEEADDTVNSDIGSYDSDDGDEDYILQAETNAYRKSVQARRSAQPGSEARENEREKRMEVGGLVIPGKTSRWER